MTACLKQHGFESSIKGCMLRNSVYEIRNKSVLSEVRSSRVGLLSFTSNLSTFVNHWFLLIFFVVAFNHFLTKHLSVFWKRDVLSTIHGSVLRFNLILPSHSLVLQTVIFFLLNKPLFTELQSWKASQKPYVFSQKSMILLKT